MFSALILAAALANSAPATVSDPLSAALFKVCPALLDGSLQPNDSAALASLGFKSGNGPIIGTADVQIDTSRIARRMCPVTITNASVASIQRLSRVLRENGLVVKELPSPVGGTLINASDAFGKLVTTSQVMNDSVVTLVVGK